VNQNSGLASAVVASRTRLRIEARVKTLCAGLALVYSRSVHRPMPNPAQLRLDTASTEPAGRQIVDQLRTLFMEGVLKPGDSLPPIRRLALDLGIHFNTVAEAYRALAQEGFLEIVHGHGARLVDRRSVSAGPEVRDDFRRRLRELVAAVRARGLTARSVAGELRGLAESMEKP
jgi:GntR family transcriptional regulator